ncbi:odorant receptor Or1-like [Anoplophora glabripennis]|uniref:odorant receptor Or1-like n=1 Tax=Anoplophora glabripennis TaxID=217634 RepID=UPI000C75F9DA|nr:odorant receptor Or1-like [Anoplophora glabripennis]
MPPRDLVQSSFKYHLLILKIFGLYPYDSFPKLYKPYAFFFYIAFTVITPILALVAIIVSEDHDIAAISQKGFMIVELNAMIVKLLPCKINPEGTRRTVFALNKKIFNSQLPEQDHILSEAVRNIKYVLLIFSTTCTCAVMTWASLPLMYNDRRFPFEVWLPFDPFQNTAVYLFLYLFVFLCTMNGGVDNAVLDTMVASLIYHAACQIRVLKDTLLHLDRRIEDQISKEGKSLSTEEREQLKNKVIYKKICDCIDHYDAIYEFVQDLERTYTVVVFSQLLSSVIIICICCLHLSVAVPLTIPFFSTSSFTVAILMEQFLYCYSGALLNEESNSVVTAIYMSDWYNYDKKSKKALLILMERAKRPMTITAGKIMDLTLVTFATVMRRSYSLLAVLKNY